MDKPATYDDFLLDVPPLQRPYVDALSALLTENGYAPRVAQAKSGYVVSWDPAGGGHVLVNYIFRKKGLLARVYGDHAAAFAGYLQTLEEPLRKQIAKSPVCRRLLDPAKCNPRCRLGNTFTLDGTEHKKCRYSNFMLLLDEAGYPAARGIVEHELAERQAAQG